MKYYISNTFDTDFDNAVRLTTEALKEEGFGVLSEIDIQKKLEDKLGVDFRKYKILGACHPPSAYKALQQEDKIGAMLPCNLIVQDNEEHRIEVAAVDPVVSMAALDNKEVEHIAEEIRSKLVRVINAIKV